ncbi:hypothetical protein A2331_03910 [Candidatus Falkowbacteria bacterium RIFOXYB2_FULL_34_18]|uniref:Uncharacterized protein n=1 Tax=Candidatus Falkowbacteria bacterium RIFOXYD2_FULL_34_120 TaxID=1798007 RepID=A0A1F5TPP3_9BACT|nr:MAG: hypothetical protein A2331_03910 [Candidatus Falkowbacteria bacterium RIFOXYB2_FULL_34_18]OGF29096.1 MAG: hypothetical protein A2500_03235 [Candidatus Falkowbacteria bacterium RIFOXYC12_FULL_34_55]OGF36179.1 MAG: hypothetical protein A2466_04765 [Candidatus Falkowbacteria bacterium RIFOXYC2_FULL_34_220]OGF38606.1 MAG: hypothetical protein A2515_02125 [Candidatus Falkowbacteria bacterium RIFOXYD12_FULL_34_57]OGF40789.1 MAG: hypothetical protein A2531_06770 [Candidatus Falkowbacteria bact
MTSYINKEVTPTKKSTLKKSQHTASAKGLEEIAEIKAQLASLIKNNSGDKDAIVELGKLAVKASLLAHIIQTLLYSLALTGIKYYDKRTNHQTLTA